jgi:hypothetical protein
VGALSYNADSAYCNTATGGEALHFNTRGRFNTATGFRALYSNTIGNCNTAFGNWALIENTEGHYNTATGQDALHNNLTGSYNTANGCAALAANTEGNANTAFGSSALTTNTKGSSNTASGTWALGYNTEGSFNTAIGSWALAANTTGTHNTAIGCEANVSVGNLYNATAIGYGAIVDASNKVVIGNTSVSTIGGQVSWTAFSDGRAKKNIRAEVPGLAFIKLLQPVTYNLDLDAIDELLKSDDPKINAQRDSLRRALSPEEKAIRTKARADKEQQVYSGFVAQDVKKVAQSIGYDFSGVDAHENSKGSYGLRYAEFVVPLVKAVQELSEQNDTKDIAIAAMQKQMNEQSKAIEELRQELRELKKTK